MILDTKFTDLMLVSVSYATCIQSAVDVSLLAANLARLHYLNLALAQLAPLTPDQFKQSNG